MNVGELIERLKDESPELEVITEIYCPEIDDYPYLPAVLTSADTAQRNGRVVFLLLVEATP